MAEALLHRIAIETRTVNQLQCRLSENRNGLSVAAKKLEERQWYISKTNSDINNGLTCFRADTELLDSVDDLKRQQASVGNLHSIELDARRKQVLGHMFTHLQFQYDSKEQSERVTRARDRLAKYVESKHMVHDYNLRIQVDEQAAAAAAETLKNMTDDRKSAVERVGRVQIEVNSLGPELKQLQTRMIMNNRRAALVRREHVKRQRLL